MAGAVAIGGGDYDGTETCGSPGEVASDPGANHVQSFWLQGYQNSEFIEAGLLQMQWDRGTLRNHSLDQSSAGMSWISSDRLLVIPEVPVKMDDGKTMLWTNTVFEAPDQLRQRVACC